MPALVRSLSPGYAALASLAQGGGGRFGLRAGVGPGCAALASLALGIVFLVYVGLAGSWVCCVGFVGSRGGCVLVYVLRLVLGVLRWLRWL